MGYISSLLSSSCEGMLLFVDVSLDLLPIGFTRSSLQHPRKLPRTETQDVPTAKLQEVGLYLIGRSTQKLFPSVSVVVLASCLIECLEHLCPTCGQIGIGSPQLSNHLVSVSHSGDSASPGNVRMAADFSHVFEVADRQATLVLCVFVWPSVVRRLIEIHGAAAHG